MSNEEATGVKINGEMLNNIRYADDSVLVADLDIQTLMERVKTCCEGRGRENKYT